MLKQIFRIVAAANVLGLCGALSVSPATAADTQTTRPNILWITVEDMSPDIPAYGDNAAHTPNLDRLAADGVLFTRAFSPTPVCSTSRSSIITGMYPTATGALHHRSRVPLPEGVRFYPAYLRDAGYFCTNRGKTDYNFPMPDDVWDQNGKNAHWRNRPDPNQPFFSIFNFTTTHEAKYMLSDEKFEELVAEVPAEHRVTTESIKLPPYIPDTPVTRADWARMYDSISLMDIEIGRVLEELEEDGLASSTIVMFYSDHGRGLPRGKRWLYDSGIQVPLIVRWPGNIKPGSRDESLVTLMDMGPTVISLAGGKVPDNMHGRVIIGEGKQPAPEYLFFTRDRMDVTHDMTRAVRDERYKYIKNFYPDRPYDLEIGYLERNPTMQELRRMDKSGELNEVQARYFRDGKPAEELYDTEADPYEINNLVKDPEHQERLKAMRTALDQWRTETNDRGEQPEPADQVR